MRERLFTPGPVEVPAEALQAESRPLIHHRTPNSAPRWRVPSRGCNTFSRPRIP